MDHEGGVDPGEDPRLEERDLAAAALLGRSADHPDAAGKAGTGDGREEGPRARGGRGDQVVAAAVTDPRERVVLGQQRDRRAGGVAQGRPEGGGDAADRPREILDAALTVFVEKGFAATKLDDVAIAAGISKGLLYRYFDNKAELFKEVIRQTLVTTIRDVGDRAQASGSAPAALDVFLEQLAAVAKDARRSAIPKLIISESGGFPELAVFYLAEVIGPAMEQLSGLIQFLDPPGQLPEKLRQAVGSGIIVHFVVFGHAAANDNRRHGVGRVTEPGGPWSEFGRDSGPGALPEGADNPLHQKVQTAYIASGPHPRSTAPRREKEGR